jgi:hypothetical protein
MTITPVSARAALRVAVLAGLRQAFSAAVWFALLAICGVGSLVIGVYMIAGMGWALVAAGAISLALAVLLLIGMNRGG